MSLSDQLNEDIKTAMRAKDKDKLTLLRSVKATFKNLEIDSGQPLSEEAEVNAVVKMIKQRKEAADGFRQGNAEERARKEDWEAEMLAEYLPAAPSEEEIQAALDEEVAKLDPAERNPKSMGRLMKALKDRFAGRPVDGKALSQTVKAKLS